MDGPGASVRSRFADELAGSDDPFLDGAGLFPGLPDGHSDCTNRSAIVVGGAVAGLGAAHGLSQAGYDVTLAERQSYADKRVNCGEAITDASLIALAKTPANGFQCSTPAFEVRIAGETETTSVTFPSDRGYVTDRNVVERSWAARLATSGVTIEEGTSISRGAFDALIEEYDLVVDATGQPALASRAAGTTEEYAGAMTAINADVEGDFTDLYPRSLVLFEGYLGYAWCFPKTPDRANVGIGWAEQALPEDYMSAFTAACERNGWPVPEAGGSNVAIIPRGPSLDPARTYDSRGVVRVGDAAGIANRFTGKGISQAIHSSYLMAALAAHDRLPEYPRRLHAAMRPEYALSYIVRGTLEADRLDLLRAIMRAVDGVDVEDVDRNPHKSLSRLARHPVLCARLLGCGAIRRRTLAALCDDWEYTRLDTTTQPMARSAEPNAGD